MSIPVGLKKSAAMVVLRHDRQFLLMKRARPPHVGKYLPVGGKLEPFEDPYSAAIRETREETGLQLDRLTFAGVLFETSPLAYNWISSIYLADIDHLPPPVCDEGVLEWVSFERLSTIPTPPTDWQIYQYIKQEKPFVFNALYNADMDMIAMTEEIEGKRF